MFHLPPGLRIHNRAVPRCVAIDEDFRAQRAGGMPSLGPGRVREPRRDDGVPRSGSRSVATSSLSTAVGELVEVVFFEGTDVVAGMDRLTIAPGRLTPTHRRRRAVHRTAARLSAT